MTALGNPAAGVVDATANRPDRSRVRRAMAWLRPGMGPLALIVIVAFFGSLYPHTFLTRTNLVTNVLEVVSFLVIVAAGQTVVMVVGEFDLSVGGVAALSTATTASFIATATPKSFWAKVLSLPASTSKVLNSSVLPVSLCL